MFEIGQRVICVDDSNGFNQTHLRSGLVRGRAYVIADLDIGTYPNGEEETAVYLENDPGPLRKNWYAARRFRPLTDKELSAEREAVVSRHFGHHLNQPQPAQV